MPFARRQSRWIVAAWLTLIVAAAWLAVSRFAIDNGVAVWFGADDPALATYREAVRDFGGHEWLLVALDQRGAAQPDRDADRDAFAAAAGQLPNVGMVLTSADVPATSELRQGLLRPEPFTGMEAVLVQVANDLDRRDHYRERLLDDVRAIGATLPTVRATHVAGTAAINGELNRAARRDMYRFFPAVVLLLAMVGLLVFRNPRDAAALLATSLSTVTLVAGVLAGLGHPLNMVTIMLPTVLIALSVADAVHLIHAFHPARDAAAAVRQVWRPSLGTTLTTVAGFVAFAGSDVMPIKQLAIFGALGVALALTLTMTFTPALLVLLWTGQATRSPRTHGTSVRWLTGLYRMPRRVLAVAALLGFLLIGLTRIEANTDYADFFREQSRVPQDYAAMRDAQLPVNALNLVVRVPAGMDPLSPEHGAALRTLVGGVNKVPGVHSVLSPLTLGAMEGGVDALMEAGFLSIDRTQVQLIVLTPRTSSAELFALARAIEPVSAQALPATMTMAATGTPYLWARMDDGVIRTQRESVIVVCAVCFVLLVWLFRSVPLAVLTLVLSMYPIALVIGLMGWLQIPVNLATVLIAGIAEGIAVDDTIYLVHTWQRLRRLGHAPQVAADAAMQSVGGSLLATSAVLVGAFSILGFSGFLPTAQFGLLSALVIVLALAADLAITPLVLGWSGRVA